MLRSLIFTTYYYIFWLEIVTMFSYTVILPTHAPKTDSFPSLNEKLFKRFKWLFRACLTKTWTVNWRGSVWSIWRCRWGCDRRLVYLWCGCHDLGIHSLSIRPSYGVRGEEILFRFHFSPFPQKRLILRLRHSHLHNCKVLLPNSSINPRSQHKGPVIET